MYTHASHILTIASHIDLSYTRQRYNPFEPESKGRGWVRDKTPPPTMKTLLNCEEPDLNKVIMLYKVT